MRFVIFVIDSGENSASPDEARAINAFNDRLVMEKHFILAVGIASPANATLIDNRKGAGLASRGSLYSDPEYYSGFWVISAESQEQAAMLARQGSEACNRKVELRPLLG